MACDSSPTKDGRFIFQKKRLINSYIKKPYEPINRVIAQKSVFVRHPDGFIRPDTQDVINIPAVLKTSMQEHLDSSHGISVKSIYNDLHGFIRDQRNHLEAYKSIHQGLNREKQGDSENG